MTFAKADILVLTHDGQFHADEVLAVALFELCEENRVMHIPQLNFPGVRYGRTRDEKELKKGDVLLDVGGRREIVRDADGLITKLYLDHHQGLPECHTEILPLATFGLTWGFLGERLIEMLYYRLFEKEMPASEVQEAYEEVRRTLVVGVDATDNGVDLDDRNENLAVSKCLALACHKGLLSSYAAATIMSEFEERTPAAINNSGAWRFASADTSMTPAYPLTLSRLIADVNGTWAGDGMVFFDAKTIAKTIIRNRCFQVIAAVAAGDRIQKSPTLDDGKVLLLDKAYPWEKKLQESQNQVGGLENVLYVIFPRSSAKSTQWVVQAVPAYSGQGGNKFAVRKLLPAAWVLPAKSPEEATGVTGTVYVNPGRWMAVAADLVAAHALAKAATEFEEVK
jgi:uncharacterized UPF0160 family protein